MGSDMYPIIWTAPVELNNSFFIMDAYEAFFDEYVDFMQKFASSENTLGMMTQYASMMARYAETMSALDEIDSDSLSEADALYYMEVTLRITKKLADIA